MKKTKLIFVDTSLLPVAAEDIYGKIFPIFKTRVEERSGASVKEGTGANGAVTVRYKLSPEMADESYEISDSDGAVVISGKNFNSLIFGTGQLLHKSRYDEEGMMVADWRGYSAPECSFRSIYFAVHFYNWYLTTTPEKLARYFEDLMLWGYNGACAIYPKMNLKDWNDPAAETNFLLLEKLYSTARSLNLKTSLLISPTDFAVPNKAVAADSSGIHAKGGGICTSCEGGYEYLRDINLHIVKRLSKIGLDYILSCAYDHGGCSCEKCAPWGGNGYYVFSKKLFADLKKVAPDIKMILTTWHFDKGINDKRDFPWLDRAIREDKAKGDDWVSYMMLETRNGMPEYIKENGVPGGCEAIDFPEITMQRLEPWGAFGVLFTPCELERVWKEVGGIMHGGIPYSEGKFDDPNKVIFAGFFWERGRSAKENFTDYCGYEFSEDIAEDLWEMSVLLEKNHFDTYYTTKKPADMDEITRARKLAVKIDESLSKTAKKRWQWRIFYIRALLDYERYSNAAAKGWTFDGVELNRFNYWRQFMLGSRLAQKLLRELIDIYEMPVQHIPQKHVGHHYVRPLYTPIIENYDSCWERDSGNR